MPKKLTEAALEPPPLDTELGKFSAVTTLAALERVINAPTRVIDICF